MSEEDILRELFSKTELNYPVEGIEEAVLKKIAVKNKYQRKKKVYDWIGKVACVAFLILCLVFTLNVGEADIFYLFLGSPFILILLMFPLEFFFHHKRKNKLSYEKLPF